MKICLVSQIFAPQDEGGAELYSREAAEYLAEYHDVVVLALGLAGQIGVEPGESLTDSKFRIYRVPFQNSYLPSAKRPAVGRLKKGMWHLRNAIGAIDETALERFFKAEAFDLIYAQNCTCMLPALYKVAERLGIPICQHLHDYALLCPRASMYRSAQNCSKPCATCSLLTFRARQSSTAVRTVISVSDFVRQRYLEHGLFRNADWHVLHNTNMDAAAFDKSPHSALGTSFTIGYLGALSQEKGVEVLLRAFCALPSSLNVRLLVAGRGRQDFVDRMQELVRSSGAANRVEWLGYVKADTIFAQSEVIVVPSLWHEPQSRVLIETAAYGLPVLAARTGGSTEIVDGNHTGWTYSSTDTDALRNLLQTAAENGAAEWRASLSDRFPGLAGFKGTAEATNFYERLDQILKATAHKEPV